MLGLLLFASALHFDNKKLKEQRLPVLLLSTLGVLVSPGVFSGLLYGVRLLLKINLPLVYCFIFGALISPTDPIAAGAILKNSKIPAKLNTIISGESMFNDAIGLVLFVTLLSVANQPAASMTVGSVAQLFAREVLGGIGIGLVAGFLGYKMIRSIRDFQTILLISIALVLGISVIAHDYHSLH
jgi:CPA1 family monovalent cation:H+ antiporter